MRKRISSIAAGLSLLLAVSAVRASTVSEATGKGAFLDNNDNVVSLQFKAGVDDLGNFYGEVQQVTKLPGQDLKWHGTVLCYAKLSHDTAVFGGIVDSSSDPSLVGDFFEVKVVDNSPDQYGWEFTNQLDCNHVSVQLNNLVRGSIHVH